MSEGTAHREKTLSVIRRSLGARGDEPGRRSAVRVRLERSPDGLVPERARAPRDDQPDLLASLLKAQGAVVNVLDHASDVPKAVADQLSAFNLPARIRHGSDPFFEQIDWEGTMIERDAGPAHGDDAVSLSRASFAAAETGTLVLVSGPDNPSTLNFLPETHFVVLRAEDISGSYEECWRAVRDAYGKGHMPRTVNFVSGTSATADIEQTLVRGAHGPRRLAVFLITEASEPEK